MIGASPWTLEFLLRSRSLRRALGSLLLVNRSQSGVIVEEEVSECISVTSKPYRMWSVQPGRLGRRDVV